MEPNLKINNKDGLSKTSPTTNVTSNEIAVDRLPVASETSSSSKEGGKHNKQGSTKASVSFEDKFKMEPDIEISELLGSVTTHNCPGVRTSARVIQKMKQDQSRPITPPPAERDHKQKEERTAQKTPSQVRTNKPIWTNLARNHFFDAVNEFGKDFEAIGNYINAKLKRKFGMDVACKTKDQVRQHYYQTFHKICKHIRFSDEVKKPAQEMYALINYGEMRRKLQFVTDKHFFKLKNLIYQGQIIVRCKGKNIRIKTPSCKALRRLNQLDDSLEDIRLPSKIEVIVSPANMEAFGRVQTIAQNPHARVTVPLQKKLINFIKNFQHKWRSSEMKFVEEEAKLFPPPTTTNSEQNPAQQHELRPISAHGFQYPEMCFLPKPGVTIHRPLLSITEYLSSVNICLSAYEERMGVKVRGETLFQERPNNKRQRTESGSEKRSPDSKKQKNFTQTEKIEPTAAASSDAPPTFSNSKDQHNVFDYQVPSILIKSENIGNDCTNEDLNDEINELLSEAEMIVDPKNEPLAIQEKQETPSAVVTIESSSTAQTTTSTANVRTKRNNSSKTRSTVVCKPLISDDVIRRIRKGWTISNAADTTIGDLYVVFGQDSRLELDYFWTDHKISTSLSSSVSQKQNGMPYNPNECDDPQLMETLSKSTVSNKLKHLLLIANLSERIRKRQCSCGHTCEKSAKARIERDLATKTFLSNKTFLPNAVSSEGSTLFRQPIVPMRRTFFNMDSVKQLSAVSRPKTSRQVLVQRLFLPGGMNHHELLNVKNLQQNLEPKPEKVKPIRPTSSSSTNSIRLREVSNLKSETCTSDGNMMQTSEDELESGNSVGRSDNFGQLGNRMSVISTLADSRNQLELHVMDSKNSQKNLSSPSSLQDSAFDDSSNTSVFNGMSPTHLIRDSTSNSRWLEENLNDFSLTSLLGHLDDINSSRDILDPSSNLSVISESSVDYMSKFQEITALMRSQDND